MDKILKQERLVSIIIPVYNVEKFIDGCIESVLNQTYKNIEIIIINDGSSDSSLYRCKKYLTDKRVKLFDIQNGGVSNARNIGIANSLGYFICFVDSDDQIKSEQIEQMVYDIEDNDLLIQKIYNGYINIRNKNIFRKYTKDQFFHNLPVLLNSRLINSPVNKLYINELIINNNLKFIKEFSLGEDLLFNLNYFKFIKNVKIVDKCSYIYNRNTEGNSLTQKFRENYWEIQKKLINEIQKIFINTDSKMEKILYSYFFEILNDSISHINRLEFKKYFIKCKEILNDNLAKIIIAKFKPNSLRKVILKFVFYFKNYLLIRILKKR